MYKTPCEYMLWEGLPIIRKELVKCMVNNFGLHQNEAAEVMGLTPAAVSQYLNKKRGKLSIVDNKILNEISISAEKIINQGPEAMPREICRICEILRSKGLLTFSSIK
jgi:predicted transcriptional regulator